MKLWENVEYHDGAKRFALWCFEKCMPVAGITPQMAIQVGDVYRASDSKHKKTNRNLIIHFRIPTPAHAAQGKRDRGEERPAIAAI